MPRKQKIGLDFFYLQCDIFSKNSELRPLLRRYKGDGLAVYLHILCDTYSNGYYYLTDDYNGYLLDIAEDCGVSINKVQLIVAFMQNRTLLQAFSSGKNTVLTSHGIQKRYVLAMKRQKRNIKSIKGKYWLLTEKEEAELDTFYKSQPNSKKNADNSEIYPDNSEKNHEFSENFAEKRKEDEKEQEKAKKKRKETKEIKESKKEQEKVEEIEKKESKKDRDIKGGISHSQIMDDFDVSPVLKNKLTEFLKSCYLNGHIISNDKLEEIIVKLDMAYRQDEQAKCDCVARAISGGYFDIKI